MEDNGAQDKEEIYANAVRAGKRTYFFDIRSTKNKDFYLTITESKKRFDENGDVSYQKHKLFLYKEDFEKFSEALSDSFKKVIELKKEQSQHLEERLDNTFTDISFDELGENGQEK
ncbi:MAG: DUF3276 family protein [Salibacteraceae bacterium]